jgi:putative phage-type endonuclease
MITQNTPEWLEYRKNKIGASDAPIILQKSPWKTPYRLWQEKVGLVELEEKNFAMEMGHANEPIALAELESKLGMPLGSNVRLSNKRSWMMASLDASNADGSVIAEIKCPGKADHESALAGLVPEKYIPQLQHQMEVCEVEMAYYFSFHVTGSVLLKVYRDEKYIQDLVAQEEKFYECIREFEAPELMDRDYVHYTDAKWGNLVEEYKELKRLVARQEDIKKQLIAMAGGQNSMAFGLKLTKCTRRGSVDYSRIPELQDVDLEKYRKVSSDYWRIT